jgi:hypothetical protein
VITNRMRMIYRTFLRDPGTCTRNEKNFDSDPDFGERAQKT